MKHKRLSMAFFIHGTLIFIFLVIASLFYLNGCSTRSLSSKGLLHDVEARRPPDVQLGTELILLEEPPRLSTSLIDKEGVAHIFLVDEDRQLNHIEILGDKINSQEVLGEVEFLHWALFDAIEHPGGKLRVIAGNKQYFRTASNLDWQEVKGNRCARFVSAGDDLFCAFVIKGEEVAAPQRTDVSYGFFILFPVASWSDTYASKLVLAQESQDGWVVRAVLDPDTPLDADPDFMVGSDSQGNLQFLYFTSTGDRSAYLILLPVGGFFRSGPTKEPILRYAQLTLDQLLAHSKDAQNNASNQAATSVQWLTIKGVTLPNEMPFTNGTPKSTSFRLLSRRFLFNKVTREVNGLMWASDITLVDGDRQLPLDFSRNDPDHLWVEVSIDDGRWSPHFKIVTAKDIPPKKYSHDWLNYLNALVKIDSKGHIHALLGSEHPPEWAGKILSYMNYLVMDGVNWSAPLVLGRSTWQKEREENRTLAVGDSGIAFAAWVNKEDKFVGRWIRPRGDSN